MSDDREYLQYAYQGNADAVALVLDVAEISHIWDDMIDRDKPVDDAQINRAFTLALLELPRNPFYRQHQHELLPVMTAGALNWFAANEYEKTGDKEAHALAHVMRYGIADLVLFIAYLIGGQEWAQQVAPELRRISQKDTLENYKAEMANSYERETGEYLKHGLHIFQGSMFADTELEHVAILHGMIRPPKNAVIVDMGCGIGEVSRLMSAMDRKATFYGVTNCRAQTKEIVRRGSVIPVHADYHSTGLPDGVADVVMFNESIGYGNHNELVKEASRLLKEGGILFIKDFISNDGNEVAAVDWSYKTEAAEYMQSLFDEAGFSVEYSNPKISSARFAEFYSNSPLMQQLHPRLYSTSKTAVWRCVKQGKEVTP